MKKFLLFAASLFTSAASIGATTSADPTATPSPPCCRPGLPPGKYSEHSIYTLNAIWTSDVGREVKLEVLRGHPQVLALFFTNCAHSCPLIVADMKAIEKALPRAVRGKVDFLLVSIDPARDTPEELHAYRLAKHLGDEHWTLLHGNPDDVKQLAEMVGFKYFPGSERQYAHSLMISVVNQDGEIVFQQGGVGASPDGAIQALLKLNRKAAK